MSELMFASHLMNQMNDMLGRARAKLSPSDDKSGIIFLVPDKIWWVLKYGSGATKKEPSFEKLQAVLDVLKPEYANFLSASDHGFLMGVPVLCTRYSKNVICINTETGDAEAFHFETLAEGLLELEKGKTGV